MNDRRQNYRSFYYPKEPKKQIQGAAELLVLITSFLSYTKLKPEDWVALNKMIRQLETHKNNISNKVLRALRNRFQNIQNQYQK